MKVVKKISDKLYLFYKKNNPSMVPLFCPKCQFPMLTKDDSFSYREHKCCKHCSAAFINEDKILVFPNKASEEWKSYMEQRKIQAKTRILIK
jgi:hypothetical protein